VPTACKLMAATKTDQHKIHGYYLIGKVEGRGHAQTTQQKHKNPTTVRVFAGEAEDRIQSIATTK